MLAWLDSDHPHKDTVEGGGVESLASVRGQVHRTRGHSKVKGLFETREPEASHLPRNARRERRHEDLVANDLMERGHRRLHRSRKNHASLRLHREDTHVPRI